MAIIVECPKCKRRLSLIKKKCPCGIKLTKLSGKTYWIEFYLNGQRKRERIGPNKQAAEQRLRKVLNLRAEERFIDKDPAARLTLGELCKWYLDLPEVKSKDSYSRDKQSFGNLKRIFGESTKIKDITSGKVESYQTNRLSEPSPRYRGERIRPATVNMEVMILKVAINRAIKHGKLRFNQIARVKKLQENNVRQRLLTQEEFDTLVKNCDSHIKGPVMMGYYMGLRQSEIINLTWPEVDLKKGFIRLEAARTKTDTARSIPIHPKVEAMLESLPRGLHTDRVFLFDGKPFLRFLHSWKTALKNAGIKDFVFHDLRHCALNNLRRAGNDFFQVMALSGHKTMSVFKRYNLVTEEELSGIKWLSEQKQREGEKTGPEDRKTGTMDTNMDTRENRSGYQRG
jgi:integrase